jgi:hypothetical protein
MSFNNGADDGKTKTGSFVSGLGCEVRLENLVVELARDSRTSILDKTDDMPMVIREMSSDSQDSMSLAFHCIGCVENKINENLAELVGVAADLRKTLIKYHHKPEASLRIVAFKPFDAPCGLPQQPQGIPRRIIQGK